MNNIKFTKDLVKGKIAETIFAQMFRESRQFTVLEFGYEKVIPQFMHKAKNVMNETLRTAPDFAVIDQNTKDIHLVEVKYRKKLNYSDVLKCAKKMKVSWNPSSLFIATLDGFYFDSIEDIINNNGEIKKFNNKHISKDTQDNYLEILKDFETNN